MSLKLIVFVLLAFAAGIIIGTGLGSGITLYNIPCETTTANCEIYSLLTKYMFGGSLGLILVVFGVLCCVYKCCC